MGSIRKAAVMVVATAGLAVGGAAANATPAAAGPYRQDCHAWTASASPLTSGVFATCNGGPINVQFRVVGLCINKYWGSSRWVEGWWMNEGVSSYVCTLSERAGNSFFQTR